MCSNNNECFLSTIDKIPTTISDTSPGDSFNTFFTLSERVLSCSSNCQVRLCKKISTQQIFVVKIISSSSKQSLEAQIIQKLNHPHIISFEGIYKNDSKQCIVLEYLPNGDLSLLLNKIIKLPEKTAAEVMEQVLSALAYCHDKGIVHRDIKPENILLYRVGKKGILCKIADFDSAGRVGKENEGAFGTLYYMAPEMLEGKYRERVDVWSSGVVMYQLLTGKLLFVGKDQEEVLARINMEEMVLDNRISFQARDLLEKMLKRDPNERISAMDACKHPWIAKYARVYNDNYCNNLNIFSYKSNIELVNRCYHKCYGLEVKTIF